MDLYQLAQDSLKQELTQSGIEALRMSMKGVTKRHKWMAQRADQITELQALQKDLVKAFDSVNLDDFNVARTRIREIIAKDGTGE